MIKIIDFYIRNHVSISKFIIANNYSNTNNTIFNIKINHLKFILKFLYYLLKKYIFIWFYRDCFKNNKKRQKRIKIEFLNNNVKF